MRQLSSQDVFRIVEWGEDKHSLDRAIVLLQASSPELQRAELLRLPLGRRDALLLQLRSSTFGDQFDFFVRCPKCSTSFEFAMDLARVLVKPPDAGKGGTVEKDDIKLRYRLPNSTDIASVLGMPDSQFARQAMLGRCIIATRKDQPIPLSEVPEELIQEALGRIEKQDPQSDITFKNKCSECKTVWTSTFDVLEYFWTELNAFSLRLQDDVHRMAQAYGWTEDIIIAMPADRRKRYVDLING
jgi:hypothetical protein